jgi:hypothetical protein
MTPEKIAKLRELAERGVDGERDTARRMLTNMGLDWRKPKAPIVDTVKSFFGADITRKFDVDIKYASDVLFMQLLVNTMTRGKRGISIIMNKIRVTATRTEMREIMAVYSRKRGEFDDRMLIHGRIVLNFDL